MVDSCIGYLSDGVLPTCWDAAHSIELDRRIGREERREGPVLQQLVARRPGDIALLQPVP